MGAWRSTCRVQRRWTAMPDATSTVNMVDDDISVREALEGLSGLAADGLQRSCRRFHRLADNFLGYRARLNICLAGSAENREFIGPQIKVIALDGQIAAAVAAARRPQRQELLAQRLFMSCAVAQKARRGAQAAPRPVSWACCTIRDCRRSG